LQLLLDDFIKDEPSDIRVNAHYTPSWWQVAKTPNQERGDWHNLVASLEERHASGSKFKATYHVAKEDEHPLCPAIVSTIENITTHNYPFWRVRCKVTD
jgi:hypothetical protein